jgi:IclR family acetate operon transcriptional repressor
MVTSGMGKAILSTYEPEQVQAIVARFGMKRLTQGTLTRASDLTRELKEIRHRGYAVDDEEYVQGLRCVAAVVRNQMGEALCAISVSGLAVRLTSERIPQIGQLVAETADALTAALGGQGLDAEQRAEA